MQIENDPDHAEAVRLLGQADWPVTHSYVVAEYVALAQARKVPRPTILRSLAELLTDGFIDVRWPDRDLVLRAGVLLDQRRDKSYSLCDAISFVLMRDLRITDALTADRHFEREGFVRLLKSDPT